MRSLVAGDVLVMSQNRTKIQSGIFPVVASKEQNIESFINNVSFFVFSTTRLTILTVLIFELLTLNLLTII